MGLRLSEGRSVSLVSVLLDCSLQTDACSPASVSLSLGEHCCSWPLNQKPNEVADCGGVLLVRLRLPVTFDAGVANGEDY